MLTMCQFLFSAVLALILNVCVVSSFNLDSFNYAIYRGADSSMFGFSVAVHKESRSNAWLIVGAPEAQSTYQQTVYRGGAVYKCPVDRDESCQEIPFDTKGDNYDNYGQQMDNKTEQWFGATVSSSGKESGPLVACAPRYTWYPRKKTRRDPVGTCYVSNGIFNHFEEYSPCRTFQWGYHRQGSCQAGFSAAINSVGDRLFIGSPGSWYWQGQMYSVDAHAKFDFKPSLFSGTYGSEGQVHQQGLESRPAVFSTLEGKEKDDDSYMGYSTIVGDFLGDGEEGIAVGMPRGNDLKGKVLIFTWNLTNVYHHFTSDQIGSYYGYALAASDVDGDKKLDLIIGSPMYTKTNNEGKYDVGRVYVIYHESSMGKYVATYVIDGFNSKSRFGQAVASLGDINQDGYGDFAVGAPYDGPKGRGAVYIYHGSNKGVRKKYSQVIYAEDIIAGPTGALTTFGFSIGGGLDLDGNEYPDMVVGAYLSNNAFFFRSRPVIGVHASVRFLTPRKVVDIKQSNYQLLSGSWATLTEIDFCLKYHGKGIPQFIDLDLQYILDTKKPKNPRMGFVENQSVNILNDTIRIYKDRDETCKRKQVYVKSNITDKLTPLEAEMKYWMQEDSRESSYEQVRNPRSVLKPILDLNSPPSRKDSISVHKECGDDNICIPDLKLTVTSNVDQYLLDQYLLDSRNPLIFEVIVSNSGEDSFETTLEVKYPQNVYYRRSKDKKVESHVLCDPYENNTLKCDIGNPIPKGKVVKFEIYWQPDLNDDMPPFYNFFLSVNSTNQEQAHSLWDNTYNMTVQLWSQARIEIRGLSYPPELYFNTSLYTEEISNQTQYTLFDDRLTEDVIGPKLTHYYYLRNIGPVTIKETEVYFIWPEKTIGGDDLVYLLEAPHFKPSDNIECDPIGANYRGFNLNLTLSKQIWDRLGYEDSQTSGQLSGSRINATQGGGIATSNKAIDEQIASSGDASLIHQQRHQNTTGVHVTQNKTTTTWSGSTVDQSQTTNQIYTNSSGSYLVSSSGQLIRKVGSVEALTYRCYDVIDGRLQEIRCQQGTTYRYYRQTGAPQSQDLTLISQCYKVVNGVRFPLECQQQIQAGDKLYQYYQQGGIAQLKSHSHFSQKCYEIVKGVRREIECGAGFQIGNLTYKCFEQVNGRLHEIECRSGHSYRYFQKTGSGLNLIANCYDESYGARRLKECGPEFQQGHITYTYHQENFGQQNVMHVCYDIMNGQRMQVDCGSVSGGSSQQGSGGGTFSQGSGTFNQGSGTFNQGSGTFNQGSSTFNQGTSTVNQGSSTVNQGSGTVNQGSGTTFNQGSYYCYEQVNGQLRDVPCQSGTYNYFRREQKGMSLISACYTEEFGTRRRIECGPEFQKGQISYKTINTAGTNASYTCYEEVNGQLIQIPCKSGTYQYFQQSQRGFNLISGCFREQYGSRQKIECGPDYKRGQITYTSYQQTFSTTSQTNSSNYLCFNYINGQLHEVSCRVRTYEYHQKGPSGTLNLIEGCYNEINGNRKPIDCSRFFERGYVAYYQESSGQLGGGSTNVVQKCYDIINGNKNEVPCSDHFYHKNASYSFNNGVNLYHRCYDIVNGIKSEVPCVPGATIAPQPQSESGKIQVDGETVIYKCYENVQGRSIQADCNTAISQGRNVTYQCFKEIKNALRPIPCGPGLKLPTGVRSSSQSGMHYSGTQFQQQQGTHYQQQGTHQQGTHQQGSHQQGSHQQQQHGTASGNRYSGYGATTNQHGTTYSNNDEEDDYEDDYDDEDEDVGKAITGYQDTRGNYIPRDNTADRRNPNTYGKYDQFGTTNHNGLEGAALGRGFGVTTVDVSNVGQGASQGGYAHGAGGNSRTFTEERSWEVTQDLPPNSYNTIIERDNVPTDRPSKQQHYYGRRKRSVQKIIELYPCRAAQCKYMTCRISNLKKDAEIAIAIRGRVNARVLKNITTSQPITISSTMAAKITKLPIVSDLPQEQYLETYDVDTTIPVTISEIKSDVVPLWVVVLSAVAGTIILLLLIFLLYKIGFFKRNRPSSAPERQPLNRNGYNHGDEAL